MQTFLLILLIACMVGAVVYVVRGVIQFMRTQHDQVHGPNSPMESGLKQNKMMWRRIQFQALAIVVVIIILMVARSGHTG